MSINELDAMIRWVNQQAMLTRKHLGECDSWFVWNRVLRRLWNQHEHMTTERRAA